MKSAGRQSIGPAEGSEAKPPTWRAFRLFRRRRVSAKICVTRKHGMGLQEAKARLDAMAPALCRQYGLTHSACDCGYEVTGTGIKRGRVSVGESDVSIELELGFLLAAFAKKIEDGISEMLEEHFK